MICFVKLNIKLLKIVKKKCRPHLQSSQSNNNMALSAAGYARGSVNPIPTGCCHVTLIHGLIPPMAGRNRVNTVMSQEIGPQEF